VTKDNVIVTPKSDSILPSITRRSLVALAEKLGYKVEHRQVKFTELEDFAEAGLCGTAAVICPVGRVVGKDKTISFPSGMEEMGPVLTKLYNTLRGVQLGTVEAPAGWIREIK
ncbi:MAG: aminotransferase class IV, partial [Selenomonas sp.]|nr:aminotransferase class IV [Selenomonas sp.]